MIPQRDELDLIPLAMAQFLHPPPEGLDHMGRHHSLQRAAQHSDLFHHAGAEERVLLTGHEADSIHIRDIRHNYVNRGRTRWDVFPYPIKRSRGRHSWAASSSKRG